MFLDLIVQFRVAIEDRLAIVGHGNRVIGYEADCSYYEYCESDAVVSLELS